MRSGTCVSGDTSASALAGAETPPDRPVVLVVDDDSALLFLAREALGQDGFTVEEAADGVQAITEFQRARPDIVLLDVNLPGADGFSVSATLRGMPEGSNVPIVMMTAPDDVRAIHRAYEVGATDFITKPLLWALLAYRLRYVLRSSRTAEYLRSSRARLARAQGMAGLGDGELDLTTQTIDWSDVALRILGLPSHPSRVPLTGCWSCVHPADRDAVADVLAAGSASTDPEGLDFKVLLPGGEERVVHLRVEGMADDRGGPPRPTVTVHDVTERTRFEARLRGGQRLEAIGRLAGGIAHDFNNLLTVIRGRNHFVLERLDGDDPLRRHVEIAERTADRAARLTQQLLAFSRKQVLQPKVLDLNEVVAAAGELLHRLIGEDIKLVAERASHLGRVCADPTQLEQVIVNLAVNARDAMPRGGRLTFRTANILLGKADVRALPGLGPGSYVMLQVEDTGDGMDAATKARIFEPFFTTKGPGKGTGLGLATVYGIIKQSGGGIYVDSEVGAGTTFTIYLPGISEVVDAVPDTSRPDQLSLGTETVLLVEDDAEVRGLVTEFLEELGYQVLAAPDPSEAVCTAKAHQGAIDLLLTDVVMPQMSGLALAQVLLTARPEARVLYMSGYTDEVIAPHGVLEPDIDLLPKPFTPEVLARRIRQVLDRQDRSTKDRATPESRRVVP